MGRDTLDSMEQRNPTRARARPVNFSYHFPFPRKSGGLGLPFAFCLFGGENGGFFVVVSGLLHSPRPPTSPSWCYCYCAVLYCSHTEEIHFPTLLFLFSFFSGFAVLLLCSLSLLCLCFVLIFSHRHSNCSGELPSSCASRRCSPSRGFCYQNSGPSFRRGKSFLLSSGHRLTCSPPIAHFPFRISIEPIGMVRNRERNCCKYFSFLFIIT